MSKLQTVELELKSVMPDDNQPRKEFNPGRLGDLRSSVKRLGIMTPLTVEKIGDKYLIVDGERRFRVANELKLDTIPAIVIAPQSKTERLLQQFHVQEQHENWSPTEKAMAVSELAEEMGLKLGELCEALAIPSTTLRRYLAFNSLADKQNFFKNKISIDWAPAINTVKSEAKRVYRNVLEEDFSRTDEKKLERAIIHRIVNGDLKKTTELTTIRDSFRKSPKSVKEFIETNITPSALFAKTKAKGAYYLRNLDYSAGYLANYIREFIKAGSDVKMSDEQIKKLSSCQIEVGRLLNMVR